MYHFNEFGYNIGKTALDKKREIQEIQPRKMIEAIKKEEKRYYEKKENMMKLIGVTTI